MILQADNLTVAYGSRVIFSAVHFAVERACLIALVGPNGGGKSSLLRVLADVQQPTAGRVKSNSRATLIALAGNPPADLTPLDLASYGLALRHRPWQWTLPAADHARIAHALRRCGLQAQAAAAVGTLSAGEIQRAWIAAALAVDTSLLLIDEPTTHLDLRYQIEVLHTLKALTASGIAIIAALHDLTLAARFADVVALLADGRLIVGDPEAVLTPVALSAAYGIAVSSHRHPEEGYLICLPG